MGYRAKLRIHSGGILNSLEALKETFNIFSHRGNANQNDPETLASEWLRSKTHRTAHAGKDVEQGEHSSTAGGRANVYNHFGHQSDGDSENWE